MAKTDLTPEEAQATALGDYKFGFHDDVESVLPHPQRAGRGRGARDLGPQAGAGVDDRVPGQGLPPLRRARAAAVGRRPLGDRLREHLLLPEAGRGAGQELGRPAARDEGDVGQAGHPRGREEVPGRRGRPVRVRGRLPQPPEGSGRQGRPVPRHGLGPARARGPRARALRHDHPVQRQQVRRAQLGRLVGRLVHLRAAGRQGRASAPGLLPHQRREHGPVRAHADPGRQGRLRALRRGLHGADLLDRLAALGGGRDPRRRGRPLPLHDDPELVDQRLQPRHQAGRRREERHHGMGRRQPRVADHDEVPGGPPQGPGRARRGALDRVRRQGPAPGRRRQDHAHGARTRRR